MEEKFVRIFRRKLVSDLKSLYGQEEAESLGKMAMEFICQQDWRTLSLLPDRVFDNKEGQLAAEIHQRLLAYEPIQHIIGTAHFYGRDFQVSPAVLIPRGETEELVQWAISCASSGNANQNLSILDIGTGSGCIPVTLALELGNRHRIQGTDLKPEALKVAKANALLHQVKVDFTQENIFETTKDSHQQLDLITSNPPYIPLAEKQGLLPNVKDYEPGSALFVSDQNPLVFYKKIIERADNWLKPGGYLLFEIHEDYGQEVLALFPKSRWEELEVRKDLFQKDRMVGGRKSLI